MESVTAALRSRLRLFSALGLAAFAVLALSGCQSASMLGKGGGDALITGSSGEPSFKETSAAAKRWQADPGDIQAGLRYVSMLKNMQQNGKALDVLAELARRNPQNGELLAMYGKELVEVGRGKEAAEVLKPLAASGKADWKVHSALGSALDQQGQHAEARQAYQMALQQRPEEISVHNNLGMSFALEGNLKEAENTLRRTAALPAAARQPRVRQNLALVVGLQGRFDEARAIASKDLPPQQIEANMAYLKSMLAQPNTWQQLKPQADAAAGNG